MNALVVIETLTPAVFSEEGGIDAMLSSLEAKVRSVPTDISTPTGRAAIKSLAHQVARSKTAFDEMGKELVSDWKAKSKAVDKERARVWDRLEALQEEVRKPLTEWEDAEKARVAGHQQALSDLQMMLIFDGPNPASEAIRQRLADLGCLPERDWQEFAARAKATREDVFASLQRSLSIAAEREAEAAELAKFRAEQAEREQKERDDRIAAEAANSARLIAESKAAREKQEAADAAAAETRRLEAEKKAADERAAKAERDAKAAVEAERKRVADAEAREAADLAKRETNEKHTKKINAEVVDTLMVAGLDQDTAEIVVRAISCGQIRHTKISY